MRTTLTLLLLLIALPGCDSSGVDPVEEEEEVEVVEEEEEDEKEDEEEEQEEDMSHPRWYFPLAVGNEWHHTETYRRYSGGQHHPVLNWHTRRRVVAAEEGDRFRVEITVQKLGGTPTVREAVWFYDEARGALFEVDPDSPTGDVLIGCTLAAEPTTYPTPESPTPCRTIQEGFFVMSGMVRNVTVTDNAPVTIGEETHHARVKTYAMTFGAGGGGVWVSLTYARGIGLIQQRHHSAGTAAGSGYSEGTKTDVLVYAQVGSRVYGQPLSF